jgi:hypothetical protein
MIRAKDHGPQLESQFLKSGDYTHSAERPYLGRITSNPSVTGLGKSGRPLVQNRVGSWCNPTKITFMGISTGPTAITVSRLTFLDFLDHATSAIDIFGMLIAVQLPP